MTKLMKGGVFMKRTINIEGMTCGHCTGRVTKALSELDGVSEVVVNLDEKNAVVSLNKEISDEQFKQEIDNVGYQVVGIEAA